MALASLVVLARSLVSSPSLQRFESDGYVREQISRGARSDKIDFGEG